MTEPPSHPPGAHAPSPADADPAGGPGGGDRTRWVTPGRVGFVLGGVLLVAWTVPPYDLFRLDALSFTLAPFIIGGFLGGGLGLAVETLWRSSRARRWTVVALSAASVLAVSRHVVRARNVPDFRAAADSLQVEVQGRNYYGAILVADPGPDGVGRRFLEVKGAQRHLTRGDSIWVYRRMVDGEEVEFDAWPMGPDWRGTVWDVARMALLWLILVVGHGRLAWELFDRAHGPRPG